MSSTLPASGTVLVIGSDTRSFLAVVRSLGRQGLAVHVVPFDFSSVALKSRYVTSVRRLPPFQVDREAWLAELSSLCDELKPDVLFPCDDRSIIPLHHFAARMTPWRVALPGDAAFRAFFDKGSTRALAHECGIPIAPGRMLQTADSAPALAREVGLPLYLKPRNSYVLDAIEIRRNVVVCRTVDRLESALRDLHDRDAYLVEGHSPGVGVGVSVLCSAGEVSQIFQHRRVREPVNGGGSSYRRSEPVSKDLEEMTRALCRATQLEGVAMFEYRVDDATGKAALLEVNARFWGSLPLAMAAGVDFPFLWFRQLLGAAPASRVSYRVPFYARNLLADLYATVDHSKSSHPGSRVGQVLYMAGWVGSLWRLPFGAETLDTLAFDDRLPAMLELRSIVGKVVKLLGGVISDARPRQRVWAVAQVSQAQRLAVDASRPVRLLVACHGNICRSPFAAALLQRQLEGTSLNVDVQGASLACQPGRPSPELAIAAAARRSVDLSLHRSVYATDEMLMQADLVVVFDGANLELLAARGLKLKNGAIRLGDLSAAQHPDISDPVDGDAAFFDRTYAAIERACSDLSSLLRTQA